MFDLVFGVVGGVVGLWKVKERGEQGQGRCELGEREMGSGEGDEEERLTSRGMQ